MAISFLGLFTDSKGLLKGLLNVVLRLTCAKYFGGVLFALKFIYLFIYLPWMSWTVIPWFTRRFLGKIIRSCCFRYPFSSLTLVEREITLTNLYFLLNVLLAAKKYVENTWTSYSWGKISSQFFGFILYSYCTHIFLLPIYQEVSCVRQNSKGG